jgi:predicted unusual protein kinase regulating ubiquinone biosynthesis (AarF/ABC1/UbiB family)
LKNSINIFRVFKIFFLLLSLFLLIKKRDSFLGYKPMSATKLKSTILELGVSFVKLAQVLATRADFFSDEYLRELKSLHDELPPMSKDDFTKVFNRAFEQNPFKSFENTPIASASIGQVHIAYLQDGTKVAVKLRREGIDARVKSDIVILKFLNSLFKPLFSEYTKNSIEAVIDEFSSMILQEVNLSKELNNLVKFSQTYSHCDVVMPKPYEQYSSQDALVMNFLEGVRFDDKEALKRLNIDFCNVLEVLIKFYAEQMLVKGFFHADPHPGNLLVDESGRLVLLDYGMVKRVSNDARVAIINLIKSAHERDFELYVDSAKKLGTIGYEAPPALVAEFVEQMFDIFENENLSSINMQKLAFEVLASTKDLPFKLPQEAIYILRVSAIIEGLGTTYIENFNGIKDILPVLQSNIPRALGYKDTVLEMIIDEIKQTPYIINDFKDTIKQASSGNLQVQLSTTQLSWLQKETKEYLKSAISSLVMMMGAIFMVLIDSDLKNWAIGLFVFGVIKIVRL